MSAFLDAVCLHHELTVKTFPDILTPTFCGYVTDESFGAGHFSCAAHGCDTPERVEEALLEAIARRFPDECDACLGCHQVPGDWADVLAGCGDCLGGTDADPRTKCEAAHADAASYLELKS